MKYQSGCFGLQVREGLPQSLPCKEMNYCVSARLEILGTPAHRLVSLPAPALRPAPSCYSTLSGVAARGRETMASDASSLACDSIFLRSLWKHLQSHSPR